MFEPAMMPEGNLAPIFREILGTGSGVGMALCISLCAMYVASGIGGYAFPLYDVEDIVPDSDTTVYPTCSTKCFLSKNPTLGYCPSQILKQSQVTAASVPDPTTATTDYVGIPVTSSD